MTAWNSNEKDMADEQQKILKDVLKDEIWRHSPISLSKFIRTISLKL